MNAYLTTTSLMQRFHQLFGVLVIFLTSFQVMATETPAVVSVDHRVSATFTKPQLDSRKGIYMTQVRITNRSGAALLSPLQLSFDGAALKNLRIKNAHGVGKNGRPYFEFKLPKGMLLEMASTEPLNVVVAVKKEKNTLRGNDKSILIALDDAQHVSAGVAVAPLVPSAFPNVLPVGQGKVNIFFSVPVVGGIPPQMAVYLRRVGDRESAAMNDKGKDGDLVANDRTFGATISVDAAKLKPDTCEKYEVFTRIGSAEVISPATKLCVSSFPARIAASDTAHPLFLPDGSKAVADELIIVVKQNASADAIRRLAADINAKIVGSILSHNMYQLKLPAPVSADRLLELIKQMGVHAEVVGASPSGIASYASSDTYYAGQHGLQLVRAQDVWDAGVVGSGVATGLGVTVTVLDSGINRQHLDFGTVGDCQLAENDCGSPSTDIAANSHGTRMAGIVGAKTNNAKGVAGVAYGSKVHSIAVGTAPGGVLTVSLPQLIDAFDGSNTGTAASLSNSAKGYTALHPEASVINVSLSGGPFGYAYNTTLDDLCSAIQNTVMNGGVRVALVVNAAGNNDNKDILGNPNESFYPARCNNHALLLNKELLITVANSASVVTPECGNAAEDALCSNSLDGTLKGSNYGSWVDITAPGSSILAPSTACLPVPAVCFTDADGSIYAGGTGTSDSAPFVSGAAAILISCRDPLSSLDATLSQIETILKTSADVPVLFPDGNSAKRLDIYRALHHYVPTATNMSAAETYFEDIPLNLTNIVVTDQNGCANVTATLTLPASVPNIDPNTLSTATSGSVTSTFTVATRTWSASGPMANVNALLAGVTFNPPSNFNDSFNITTSVSDGFSPAITGTKVMSGTPVNDTPSFVKGADQSVLEDSGPQTVPGWATGMSKGPTDEAAQTLSFILSDSALFSTQPEIDPVTGTLTYTPAPGATGSATITVELMDTGTTANGGVDTSAPQTFVITLTHKLMGLPSINPPAPAAPAQRHVSDVLTSVTSGMSDADCPPPPLANNPGISDGLCTTGPCSLGYQWMASDTFAGTASAIPGTPGTPDSTSDSTYTLRTTDVGKFMSLCVSTGMGPNCSQQCSANDAVDVGDPHITTVDGLHYDFQSEGEFVALRGANGMEIQTRQTAVSTAPPLTDSYTGLTSGASVNSAVAARVGKYRVTYQPDTSPNAVAGTFVLRVDGVPTTLPVDGIDLGDGGRVISQPSASGIQIDFPDQTTLMINNNWGTFYGASWLHVSVFHTSAYEGIMGARSKGSWLPRLPNGSALGAMPAALHERYVELYVKFADSWRVNKETTLFDYDKGTSTETFTNKAWPTENGPYNAGPGPVAKPLMLKAAQLACRDVVGKNEKADCIFDVRVMGRVEIAKGHLLTQKIRTGLTAIFVRDDRDVARDKEVVTFTATVARHAAIARMEFGRKGVPTGTVQFMLNGKKVGKPIKLNAKGQASWRVSRQKVEKQLVGAQYIPAKGNVFLPSRTLGTARLPVDVKKTDLRQR